MMKMNARDVAIQWEGISNKQWEGGEESINETIRAKNPFYLGGFN